MATSKSPLAGISPQAGSAGPSSSGSYEPALARNSSYFPNYQHQGVDQTRSNTIANAHIASSYADGPLAAPVATRPARFTEEWDASQRGSSINDAAPALMQRSSSFSGSTTGELQLLARGNTLKKKPSLRRGGSLKRSSSRRSMKAGSVRSLALQSNTDEDEMHSAFYCPVPTTGNPTEVLAGRFLAWRKMLKDLISCFREVQNHYEHRSKSLTKLSNAFNNTTTPPGFLASGGLDDALVLLRNYNKQAILEANKAREIEEEVIQALMGLRSDLSQKIKEIKNLSGDFKNSVEKEMESTRKSVNHLQEILGQAELDSSLTTGKHDPYLLRLAVDRQLERQIDEENYLHQAYLNLESSGRELESIVVGEIQKSYNAYAGILKREAEAAWGAIEELRVGPIAMPKDHEWAAFVQRDEQFVDPDVPIRSFQYIHYPGRDHYACQEIRAGLLERKSKYLKSYTAGWYVLSPTHLHEFKSADKTQAPVMSLFLPEQKLGSHSLEGGSSNKFILKGRQTGSMHRGHTWVFRAESHDTMMAWYEDIKSLTEKTPQERSDFVRGHSRSISRASQRSVSSDGVVDEDDDEPFAADAAVAKQGLKQDAPPRRPTPGGRFPSEVQASTPRGLQVPPLSPASMNSGPPTGYPHDAEVIPGTTYGQHLSTGQDPRLTYGSTARTPLNEAPSRAVIISQEAREDGINPYTGEHIARTNRPANYAGAGAGAAAALYTADQVTRGRAPNAHDVSSGYTDPAGAPNDALGDASSVSTGHQETAPGSGGRSNAEVAAPVTALAPAAAAAAAVTPVSGGSATEPQQLANGHTTAAGKISRPRNDSVPTISNLHIPGEFPPSAA